MFLEASMGEIFSGRARADSRTYFFNVKENSFRERYLIITESKGSKPGQPFERAKIMIDKKYLSVFNEELQKIIKLIDE